MTSKGPLQNRSGSFFTGWHMIFFEAGEGRYDVEWSPDAAQREQYEDAFWQIVDTIEIGK